MLRIIKQNKVWALMLAADVQDAVFSCHKCNKTSIKYTNYNVIQRVSTNINILPSEMTKQYC